MVRVSVQDRYTGVTPSAREAPYGLGVSLSPQPNAETLEVLLDTMWRMATNETARTDAIDRKASTLVTFAALVTTLTSTLGAPVDSPGRWSVALLAATLFGLVTALVLAVLALFPREYLTLRLDYLRRFPLWGEILKPPEQVRGETMQGLVHAIAGERAANDAKARLVKWSYSALAIGLALTAVHAVTLAVTEIV